MKNDNNTAKKVMLVLLKDLSAHTITTLAKEIDFSRVGMWKLLKKLESSQFIFLQSAGSGKTSTLLAKVNWKNPLTKKILGLYLTEDSLSQRRWRTNFMKLEGVADFLILYGSILHSDEHANDIDLFSVVSDDKNFVAIEKIVNDIQKTLLKKIHIINFKEHELEEELLRSRPFIDAIKKGVVLFGQERFITFMERVHSLWQQ